MTELVRLKQTGSVKDFQANFDNVLSRLSISNENAISIFLNGLKPKISDNVRIGKPNTLPQAYHLARLHESSFAAKAKVLKSSAPSYNQRRSSQPTQGVSSYVRKPTTTAMDFNKKRRLTPAEMDDKRAKGLCYFCDEKFLPGHKCKAKRHLFSIEIKEEMFPWEEDEEQIEEEKGVIPTEEVVENCAISLHAFNKTMGYRTLRVQSCTENKPIRVLIDCGSTHNFIDEKVARLIGCELQKINP